MSDADRVDLGHAPGFTLGRLAVRPATRELIRDDGEREVIEPRVMQVLVALVRAGGGIVTRDELSRWCWEGRVVGEDAINRVLSRLRRSAEGIGKGSFEIETITKVGYRLLRDGAAPPDAIVPPPAAASPSPAPRFSRRALIGGGVAVAVAGGVAAGIGLTRRTHAKAVPPEIAQLWAQANIAFRKASAEGNNEAIGLLRRIVEIAPDFPDAWGLLSVAYGEAYWGRGGRNDPGMLTRANEAAAKLKALDPASGWLPMCAANGLALIGNWAKTQGLHREAIARAPDNDIPNSRLANSLSLVGRVREAIPFNHRAIELAPNVAHYRYFQTMLLWSAGRLDEADSAVDTGLKLFPSHYALWFARCSLDMYSGQTRKAAAWIEDKPGRPVGYGEEQFDRILLTIRALETRAPADIDAAMKSAVDAARTGVGFCQIAIQYACALGRIDTAFEVADALFFGRGFDPGEIRYTAAEAMLIRRNDRYTNFLFYPSTAPMRADPRFAKLTGEIGLETYWRETGSQPDYRKSPGA